MFDWLAEYDKGIPIEEDEIYNIDEFRIAYEYQDLKETLGIAHRNFNESEEAFTSALKSSDINTFAYHYRRYLAKNRLASIFVDAAVAMVRRNAELGYEGIQVDNAFRRYWRFAGFKFHNQQIADTFKNLKITPVAKPEERRELKLDVPDFKEFPIEISAAHRLDPYGFNTDGFGHFY